MITKNVAKSCRVTTVTAADEVTAVVYTNNYKYFQLRNDGDEMAYMSDRADVAEGSDGTMSIPAGGCGQIYAGSSDTCYVKGAGTVLIAASNLPDWGFKFAQRGGDTPTPTPTSGGKIELTPLYDGEIPTSGSSVVEVTITADTDILQICPRCLGANGSTTGYVQTVCVPISKLSVEEMQLTVYSYISSTSRMGNFLVSLEDNKVKIRASHTWLNYATIYGQHVVNEAEDKPTNSDITASGNPVIMDGLQGSVPFSEIVVSCKNLTGNTIISTTGEPVIVTNTDNWSIEWTTGFGIRLSDVKVEMNKDYTVKYLQKSENGTDSMRIMIINSDTGNTVSEQNTANVLTGDEYTDNTFTFNSGTAKHIYIRFVRATSTGKATLSKMIQLEVGDIATDYEPPITGRELKLTASGKNLLKYPYMTESGKVTSGVTFTANSDGSITLNGTSTAYGSFNFTSRLTKDLLLNGMYTLSGATADAKLAINATRDGKATTIIRTQSSSIFTTDYHDNDNEYGFAVFVEFDAGKTFDNVTIFPQLEIGDTATDYEPYHGSTVTITPDSNPYIVSNDIRQQNGHNVITASDGTLSVTGCKSNMAVKRIWDKLDELATAIIVSNGENE